MKKRGPCWDLKSLWETERSSPYRLKPCAFGFGYGTAAEAAERVLRSAEAFRTCVEAVGLGRRAQPGMAVPRGFAEKCERFQVAGLRCRGFDAGRGKPRPYGDLSGTELLNPVGGGADRRARGNHSERRACMTSTRAARAAGSIEATTAAPNSTNAETITGNAPGIFKSPK